LGLGLDYEFNSIHFGKEINKCLKFLGLKIQIFLRGFKKSRKKSEEDTKTFGSQNFFVNFLSLLKEDTNNNTPRWAIILSFSKLNLTLKSYTWLKALS